MRLIVFKTYNLVGFILVVAIMGFSILLLLWDQYRSVQQRHVRAAKVYPDVLRSVALCTAAEQIYERTGLLFTNRPALERSAFYPFLDSYERGCAGGYLDIAYVEGERSFWVVLIWDNEHTRVVCRRNVPTEATEKRTQRLLNFYLSGVRGIWNVVNSIRQHFLERHREAVKISKGTCTLQWQDRPLPIAPRLKDDLPTNESELREYVQWLSHKVVGGPLSDGWGRPIAVSLKQGYLSVRSAGEDGQLYTNDDIVVRRRAMLRAE